MADNSQDSVEDMDEDILLRAEELVHEMQHGNDEKVAHLLGCISQARENGIYNAVGKMTRQFHDALNAFCLDSRIDELAEDEIPDARSRLKHVITMTQKSADRSLSAVEYTMPKCDQLSDRIRALGLDWKNFKNREMSVEQFRELSTRLETFFVDAEQDTADIRTGLNDIMMAQDFQDLTGQIITRVIELVEEVEGNLVELVKITSEKMGTTEEESTQSTKSTDAEGPQVPGVQNKNEVVSGQDDVDDLLSSLGF
ncbi:MAG: protein phosphatase CheZ [Gammaproteobacteria bacterium]|nr:protein phosphatase CheZ [Gammaproteobacteria bacterium]